MQEETHIGDRFGKLVIVSREKAGARGGVQCICRCDCGNEFLCYESQLLSGKTKSCGCIKSPDIAGERFGLLTVVGRSEKRGPRGKRTVPLWECRCDCGAIVYKAKDTLTGTGRCSCQKCANKLNPENSRKYAGYDGGTQLSRIVSKTPIGDNISGRRGVCLDKHSGRWRARIRLRGETINLGYFAKLEDAVKARQRAEEMYFEPLLAAQMARDETA